MTVPLIVLAVLSVIGGVLNLPAALGGNQWLAGFLEPVFADSTARSGAFHLDHSIEYILMAVSALAAVVMALFAYRQYVTKETVPLADEAPRGLLARWSYHKFYIDEIYHAIITRPLEKMSVFFYRVTDRSGIDGLVNTFARSTTESGRGLRLLQSGNVGFYIFMMVLAAAALLVYGLFKV